MASYTDSVRTVFSVEGAESLVRAYGDMATGASQAQSSTSKAWAAFEAGAPAIRAFGDQLSGMSREWVSQYKNAEQTDVSLKSLAENRGFSSEATESIVKMSEALMMKTGFSEDVIKKEAVAMMNFGMSAEQVNKMMPMLARQAMTLQRPLEGMGFQMGRAFGSGNLGQLMRAGVTIDDASKVAWKAAMRTTDWNNATQVAALRALVLQGAMKGIDKTAVPLSMAMQTSAGKSRLFDAEAERLHRTLGEGAYGVSAWTKQWGMVGMQFALTHPEATRMAGAAASLGGQVLKGVGGLMQYVHYYNEIRRMMILTKGATEGASAAKGILTAATTKDIAAEKVKAGVAKDEAGALKDVAGAAGQAAAAKNGLAGIKGGTGSALGNVGLMAAAAVGGWEAGSWIGQKLNIGGAGEAKTLNEETARKEQDYQAMLEEGGFRVNASGAVVRKGKMRARGASNLGGDIQRQPDGSLRMDLTGVGTTSEDMQDMDMMGDI